MNHWLDKLIEQHSELESPLSFWKWSALCAISAVVKDNVWFDKQIYNLYPNIYVMLHADSGLKKGPPISMANKLVSKVNNTRIIAGRSSIQGILKEMGTAQTLPGGHINKTSSVFICLSELTSSIVSDPVATDILTDLFDRHYRVSDWRSLLKMESFTLKDPTVTMLAGTNEAHAEEFFTSKDVHGGYFARTFIIHEKKRNAVNSLMFALNNPPNYDEAINYLAELSKLRGAFEMDASTRTMFNDWYVAFTKLRDEQQVKDDTGTLNRFDDSVLKVAMLLSLGSSPDLFITRASVEEAIKECEKLIGNVRRTTLGNRKATYSTQKVLLIKELVDRPNHSITRQQLHNKYYLHANVNEWDDIVKSLAEGGHVRVLNHGNVVIYEMPEKAVEHWTAHFAGQVS